MRAWMAAAALAPFAACGQAPPEDALSSPDPVYSVREILNEADVVAAGSLVDVDRARMSAVLKIVRPLKGDVTGAPLRLKFEVSFLPYHDVIRRRLVDHAPVVVLVNGNAGMVYLNRVFYFGYLDGKGGWSASNIERRMNRAYNGEVEGLADLIPRAFAGEAVPPAPQLDLEPIDTPSLLALPLEGEGVDEEYLPAPFRRKPPSPPVFAAPEAPAKVVDGLRRDTFEGTTRQSDLSKLKPSGSDVVPGSDLPYHPSARLRGFIDIPSDGVYSFFLRSGGFARLRVGPGIIGAREGMELAMDVALKAGFHAFELTYLAENGSQAPRIEWAGPGFTRRPPPAKLFSHPDP